ncbi:MAG: FkbM family methyltransferase [Chitinophagaceae bacterium]
MQNRSFSKNIIKGLKKRFKNLKNQSYKKANLSWLKIKYLKHATPNRVRKFEYNGKKIFYHQPLELLHALNEIFIEEVYKQELPAKPYILDCGANIGLSIIYLKENHPDAEIIGFEPDRKNFELLQYNIDSFKLKNVILNNEAVWTADTELSFAGEGSMGSRIETSQTSNTVNVKAIRLKNYLNKKVDFLKIDIEGAEFEVIKDIKDELSLVENLFLEYHGRFDQNNELVEMLQIVSNAGFNFYIKEAASIYSHPFIHYKLEQPRNYDVQLNIFCFKN